MSKFADLHIHTYFSDATLTPQEIVDEALSHDISCISITDHDTVGGINPTREVALSHKLEIIAGIELSSEVDDKDIHILGYLIDTKSRILLDTLEHLQRIRSERITKMIDKLKNLGVNNIEPDEIFSAAISQSLGRPHLAALLVKKGLVRSTKEAFDRYLAEGRPAYVKKAKLSPQEAIELIIKAGGVAVLAHPVVSNVDELIPDFVKAGLKGIEIFYPNCAQTTIQYYSDIAKKYNLVITGGSDAHGLSKDQTFIGKIRIPYSYVENLKQAA